MWWFFTIKRSSAKFMWRFLLLKNKRDLHSTELKYRGLIIFNVSLIEKSHKKARAMPKYTFNALRRHTFNSHKFNALTSYLSFWEPFTDTLRVVSKWIHVHLRQLAHVKISYLRTNKWPGETHFRPNPRLTHFCAIVFCPVLYILILIINYNFKKKGLSVKRA